LEVEGEADDNALCKIVVAKYKKWKLVGKIWQNLLRKAIS
jgi:hypothetical protein